MRNDLSLFTPYLPVNALAGPIFHVVGNHDIDYDATSADDGTWRRFT